MRVLPLMILVAVLAAGCVSSGAKPAASSASSATAGPGTDTGSISGVVVNDETLPIAGATAVLMEATRESTTDASGRFTFNELAPGAHKLLVQRIGYEPFGQTVTVAAGEVTEVQVLLKQVQIDRPWVDVQMKTRDMVAGSYAQPYPNNLQTWASTWTLKDDPAALVDLLFEVDWSPQTALGDGVRFYSGISAWSGQPLCVGEGHDPYRCLTPREKLAQDWGCDEDCMGGLAFRPGGSRASGNLVGLWPDGSVTTHVSHFYRQPMPTDYTALG